MKKPIFLSSLSLLLLVPAFSFAYTLVELLAVIAIISVGCPGAPPPYIDVAALNQPGVKHSAYIVFTCDPSGMLMPSYTAYIDFNVIEKDSVVYQDSAVTVYRYRIPPEIFTVYGTYSYVITGNLWDAANANSILKGYISTFSGSFGARGYHGTSNSGCCLEACLDCSAAARTDSVLQGASSILGLGLTATDRFRIFNARFGSVYTQAQYDSCLAGAGTMCAPPLVAECCTAPGACADPYADLDPDNICLKPRGGWENNCTSCVEE